MDRSAELNDVGIIRILWMFFLCALSGLQPCLLREFISSVDHLGDRASNLLSKKPLTSNDSGMLWTGTTS